MNTNPTELASVDSGLCTTRMARLGRRSAGQSSIIRAKLASLSLCALECASSSCKPASSSLFSLGILALVGQLDLRR